MARQVPPLCDFYPYQPVVKLDLLLPSDVRIMDQAISLIIDVIGDKGCPSDLEEIDPTTTPSAFAAAIP